MDSRRAPLLGATSVPLLLLLLLPAVLSAGSKQTSCTLEDCAHFRAIRFYSALGCVRSGGTRDCCPSRFNCSSLLSLDKTKCHYEGVAYEPGTHIQNELEGPCVAGCQCDRSPGGEASFQCGHFECPELLHLPVPFPECYMRHEVGQCCSTGVYCRDNTLDGSPIGRPLARCDYEGETYMEGQFISVPDNVCKTCICTQEFDGTLEGPWCRKNSYSLTLWRSVADLARCAPVFYENMICRPAKWHCPSDGDTVVRKFQSSTRNEGDRCTFGSHRLQRGDQLTTSDPRIICSCDVPPFITCTQFAYSYGTVDI